MTANAKKVQVIASLDSKPEYVLIPYQVYRALMTQVDDALNQNSADECAYAPFRVETYVDNPVALARIKARLSQEELARRLGVRQTYIRKIKNQKSVTAKTLTKVKITHRHRTHGCYMKNANEHGRRTA